MLKREIKHITNCCVLAVFFSAFFPISLQAEEKNKKDILKSIKRSSFTQYSLKNSQAGYKLEGPLAVEFMKQMNIGGTVKNSILYNISLGKNDNWNLKINIMNGANAVLTYRVVMDKNANVKKERITAIEYVQHNDKSWFKKRKRIPKTNKEDLIVSIENQHFLGKSKILRRTKNGKLINELSVSPNEIITTFGQIVAFMGTIKDLPPQGIKVRWVAEGKPLPVLIKKMSMPQGYVINMFKAEAYTDAKKNFKPLLQFHFDKATSSFSYPSKIVMDVNGLNLEIVRN